MGIHTHMHTDVQMCAGCVCVQEEQAADSWAKAKTYALVREGDSEKAREVGGTHRDSEKASSINRRER